MENEKPGGHTVSIYSPLGALLLAEPWREDIVSSLSSGDHNAVDDDIARVSEVTCPQGMVGQVQARMEWAGPPPRQMIGGVLACSAVKLTPVSESKTRYLFRARLGRRDAAYKQELWGREASGISRSWYHGPRNLRHIKSCRLDTNTRDVTGCWVRRNRRPLQEVWIVDLEARGSLMLDRTINDRRRCPCNDRILISGKLAVHALACARPRLAQTHERLPPTCPDPFWPLLVLHHSDLRRSNTHTSSGFDSGDIVRLLPSTRLSESWSSSC